MEIISYTEAPAGSKHIAEIEIYHNRTYYRRIRVMTSLKGFYFVNFPVFGLDDGKGGKKWIQFWEFSRSEDEEFKRMILEELQPYLKGTKEPAKPKESYQNENQRDYQPERTDCPF